MGQREELRFFHIESHSAAVKVLWRYRYDESTDNTGLTTKSTESLLQESLLLRGKGFLGNPNLVSLDMNVSLRLSQEDIDINTGGGRTKTSEVVNEYDVSALILRMSDTPLTIYSRRSQVLLDRQFADSLDSITSEHGFRLSVRSDFAPSQFQFFRREQEQTGRFSGTDSLITQDSFSWQGRVRPINGHRAWWDYTYSNVDEAGELQVSNTFSRHDASFNHTYDFGTDTEHSFRSSVRLFKETGRFPIDRLRIIETLRLQHTQRFETKYIYLYDRQDRRGTAQDKHQGTVSFRHDLFESLTTTGQAGASVLKISEGDFQSTEYFGDIAFQYKKEVPMGVLSATLNAAMNRQDDSDRGSSIFITDESYSFGVSGVITLSRRNITPGSVVVTDLAGLTIYVEGVDYTVQAFANSVEVQRVLGGNISAGQAVLIDYEIGPEPENTTETRGYGLSIRYRFDEGWFKGLSPYLRYRDQSQSRSTAGLVELPETDFQDLVLGVDYQIGRVTMLAEHQFHDSSDSPFGRTRFEGRYTERLSNRSAFTIAAYYQETDRERENLQTAITNITARLSTRNSQALRSSVVGIYRHEEDNAGTNSDAYELALDLAWRRGQTSVYCTLRSAYVDNSSRESTFQTFTFGARREF